MRRPLRFPRTNYFLDTVGIQIQEHCPLLQARPQLEEAVQGEGWDVGHAPALPSILHLLLELYPPTQEELQGQWHEVGCSGVLCLAAGAADP